MNLINFVNLESASQPIEGLGAEGKAGIFPMESDLAGNAEGKAFGTTFNEQLRRDGLEPGLNKRNQQSMKDTASSRNSKTTGDSSPDMRREKSTDDGSLPISGKQKVAASENKEAGEGRIHGRLVDWNPDAPVIQLTGELVDVAVVETTSASGETEAADKAESRSLPVASETEESLEGQKGPKGKGRGLVNSVSANPGEADSAKDWIPGGKAGSDSVKGRQNPNGEQRPVTWTREHASGEKMLPERTERPIVPQQAQASFARETSVISSGSDSPQTTVNATASSSESSEPANSETSRTLGSGQGPGQALSGEKSPEAVMEAGRTRSTGERPEVPPQAQARFVREGDAPERPQVPQQAQARFVREGDAPERPQLPQQAQAKFVREGEPENIKNPARHPEPTVQKSATPIDSQESAKNHEGLARDRSSGIDELRKEQPVRSNRGIARESAERPSVPTKVQTLDKQEGSQGTERIAQSRERLPERAPAPVRPQHFNPQQQSTTTQSQTSANTVTAGNTPVEMTEAAIPETVSNAPSIRRRESPRDRYNRLAETRPVTNESLAAQEGETTGTQKTPVDPTRRAALFTVGQDKDSAQRERNRDVEKSDDPGSRADRNSSIHGKAQGAISRPQTVQVSNVNDAFLKIMSTVERIAQNAVTSRVQLNIDLENGEKMKVMLKVAKGHVQTVFMTDSDGLRGAMKEGWEQFQRQLSDKGFAYSEPEFRGSGQDRENSRQQAEQSWNDVLDDTAGLAQPKGIQSAAADAESAPVTDTVSPGGRHALDAYA